MDLPEDLNKIHNTFYVSQLRKCVADDSTVVLLDDIQIDDRLNYVEGPLVIFDWKTKALHNKVVSLVKVQWQHQKGSEWTWEPEAQMQEHYPKLFTTTDFEDEILLKWGRIATSGYSSIYTFNPWCEKCLQKWFHGTLMRKRGLLVYVGRTWPGLKP